ncbi:ABC transporter ATP-binding protein [Brachybacterium fresconis]|uniref:Spermidine/putrescine transport system ATP-binding protein n=1 Tax=Brachybacterium fresconis TaxID=173363 RepID=A0ABS4YI02_9MICO|nr:ABC transporter ATP-binding protein [Brachybacterium fresconis]MBP2408422.1 putative spermidine/putrescine transport system ATP-binding protein [Brachybacterium fresconis]
MTTTSGGEFDSLRIENVGRRFGGTTALQGFDLTVQRGEFIALLGPSGCGKSTALNCLAGLLPLTDGQIRVGEQRIDLLPPEKRDFGMVFQSYALFPHLTVAKNVAFGLQMRGVGRSETTRRVTEALRLVRLEDQATKLPGQLSGGQQQRVAIARAIVIEPRVVLMDEPLSNLDAKLRLEMRTEIRRLHQTLGLTTIYVTHDQEEALSLADRLVVLRLGQVQQIGTPQELHDGPANWHVADFMGYRNLIDATVSAERAAADGEGRVRVAAEDMELLGTAVNTVAAGDEVRVAVRPTDLLVQRSDHAGPTAANTIQAEVEVVEYQGREYAVEVRTPGGRALHVRSEHAPEVGSTVLLTVEPSRALVYQRDLDAVAPAEHADAVAS